MHYQLAEHDDVLYVKCADLSAIKPEWIILHWKTKLNAHAVKRAIADSIDRDWREIDLAKVEVVRCRAGEYLLASYDGETLRGNYWYVELIDGGQTKSADIGVIAAQKPRVSKKAKLEWSGSIYGWRVQNEKSHRFVMPPSPL